ncbi:MAG TPA: class I SAM-dependent methyltransferase, partial [Actinoplanes sp.]
MPDQTVPPRAAQAASFGPIADVYERARPTYPDQALDWLLPPGNPRVVDLGAGTGKLTRRIHHRGLPVTAVDPSGGMLAQLQRAVPGVPTHVGTAENIPLPDGAADVVLVAQAWHWVDPARAVPEVARILSPGGRLGLVWNLRDERADWVRRLGDIVGRAEHQARATIGTPFGPVESARFHWTQTLGPESLIDLVSSRSAVILMPPLERAAL